ncbi:MAG: hypothetical protein OEX82_05615 [Nitrosomonas sp.]|nr:hypothetical protein [Nitrosomonas sp.]
MNEYIETFISGVPLNAIGDRSWFELASILAPSVFFIVGLFLTSLFLRKRFLKKTIYLFCITLSLVFLPYELFRQATEMSKADANITSTQASLKKLLDASSQHHIDLLTDKDVAAETLEKLLFDASKQQKHTLLMVSWLIAENEIQARRHQNDKYQSLSDDLKLSLSAIKEEIIDSRTPIQKITDEIQLGIDRDVTHLIEIKMKAFNDDIDNSLQSFQKSIGGFIQDRLHEYDETLDLISQKNIDELRQHADQARIEFANQVNESNKKSIARLEDTKKSVDNVGAKLASVNLEEVVVNVNQLSLSVNDIKKRNQILFTYNECLRTVGLIDLAGKEAECRNELNLAMDELN